MHVWIYMRVYMKVGRERVSLMRARLGEMDGWDIYSDGEVDRAGCVLMNRWMMDRGQGL